VPATGHDRRPIDSDDNRMWLQTEIADAETKPAARYRTVADVHGQLSEAPQPARNAG